MKYAISVIEPYSSGNLVAIDELTPDKVEKAARHLLNVDNPELYFFKLNGSYGGLLYRNDSVSKKQIKVFIYTLETLK